MAKFFFLGIDGASWDLILPWIQAGKLPNFKRLYDRSRNFRMISTDPPYTACAWPSMFTGLKPIEHGFIDFRKMVEADLELNLDTSSLAKKTLWYHLSKVNKRVCVFNIPMTYPAPIINGVSVSGFASPSFDKDAVYPKTFYKEFCQQFPNYQIWPNKKYNPYKHEANDEYVESLINSLQEKITVAQWLYEKESWDAFFVNFQEIDHAQHFFWNDLSNPESKYHRLILDLFVQIDSYLAQVLADHKKEDTICFASDHGFGPTSDIINVNVWLEKKGYLTYRKQLSTQIKRLLRSNILHPKIVTRIAHSLPKKASKKISKANKNNANTLVRKIFLDLRDIDFENTSAISFGQYAGIYLTRQADKTTGAKIIQQLSADFPGRISNIKRNLPRSKPAHFPDIEFSVDNYAITGTSVFAFAGSSVFERNNSGKSGDHRLDGCFSFTTKQKIKKLEKCSIYDLYPTMSLLNNIAVTKKLRGRSLITKALDLEV